MRKKEIGALATLIMHERDHVVLLEPREDGMLATILRSPEEVRDAKEAFRGTKKSRVGGELLDVAQMLIDKKMGKFEPSEFKDHYETALKALIKAKKAGRKIKEIEPPEKPTKPSERARGAAREPEARRPRASAPGARRAPRRGARRPRRARASAKKRA